MILPRVFGGVVVGFVMCDEKAAPAAADAVAAETPAELAPVAAPRGRSVTEQMMDQATYADAVAFALAHMRDSDTRPTGAAVIMAQWWEARGAWGG